jgi:1-acyl-sn-glycerol-3-phosphate acyltransferase
VIAGLVRVVYRVDARGLEHVPSEGAALVVANHASFVDALVIGGLCRRPIRFVMDHRMTNMPGLGWLFRAARVIPVAPAKEDPALLERAFAEIDAALAAGEVVGIFPEGKCTRDGAVDVFRPGVERILAARRVPVVPVAIDGLWGSFFSYANGAPMRTRPRRFWSRVTVRAGAPTELRDASAMREAVLALLARVGRTSGR